MDYLAIILLPFLVAAFPIFFKIQKDKKEGNINPVGVGGWGLFFLLLSLGLAGALVLSEQKKSAEADRNQISEKARTDSVRYIINLINLRQGMIMDSMNHIVTINKLNIQDSSALANFGKTLFKLDQNLSRQNLVLDKQGQTLQQLSLSLSKQDQALQQQSLTLSKQSELLISAQNIKHPLFPLKIFISTTIHLDSLPFADNVYLQDCSKEFHKTNKKNYPSNFKVQKYLDGIQCTHFNILDDGIYDPTFSEFNKFIIDRIFPDYSILLLADTNSPDTINLAFSTFRDSRYQRTKDYYISYYYTPVTKTIRAYIEFTAMSFDAKSRNITSMLNFEKGRLEVYSGRINSYYYLPEELNYIAFACGNDFNDVYWAGFDRDRQKYYRNGIYYMNGADFIK
jgi:hypothetical protein